MIFVSPITAKPRTANPCVNGITKVYPLLLLFVSVVSVVSLFSVVSVVSGIPKSAGSSRGYGSIASAEPSMV